MVQRKAAGRLGKGSKLKVDKIVKSHFVAWIPAFAGMTDFVSIRY